ncbi:MAG: ankyrin repeat domain-containing protein [FCB group bacterium]|jgi:cytohesin|nr:ankyrin repeat domain-containing protein [FCB group bacterium]
MQKAEMIFDAIVGGDTEDIQQQMEKDPSLVNAVGPDNLTPLHVAAREGNRNLVAWLIEHGADIKAVDGRHGATPLGWAAYYGKPEPIETLLEAGADPKHRNTYGLTPYQVAEEGTEGKWEDASATSEDYHRVMDILQGR